MGNCLLWATWSHDYMAIFVKMYVICDVILTKLGQHVNEMMKVAVKKFQYF